MSREWIDTRILFGDPEAIEEGAQWIRQGELVAFPTETVYGLGADGLNPAAVAEIFRVKGRPQDNPLILHISEIAQVDALVREIPQVAYSLMESLWPGPLTLIFKKSDQVPDIVTAGGDTVAIRMPSHPTARELIRRSGTPIAAPSANLSGKPSPTNAQDTYRDLKGRIPLVLDGGACEIGIESTVLDLTESPATILRPGYFTQEMLGVYLEEVNLDQSIVKDGVIPRSPGQKYRHYAPKAEMTVFLGAPKSVQKKILMESERLQALGKKVGFLLFEEDRENMHLSTNAGQVVFGQGSRKDLRTMAHRLFASLRAMDFLGVDVILAEGAEEEGLGISIMNRMKKSASGHVVWVEERG